MMIWQAEKTVVPLTFTMQAAARQHMYRIDLLFKKYINKLFLTIIH